MMIGLLALALIGLALPVWFAYGRSSTAGTVRSIPPKSIVLALGFVHLGEDEEGRIRPGPANQFLADWLENNRASIRVVLAQRGVSDALPRPDRLSNGVPVLQMHAHRREHHIRTLEALQLAVNRFKERPKTFVILAHDKHAARAKADLQALCPDAEILVADTGPVPYWGPGCLKPLLWAAHEVYLAIPADALRRRFAVRYPREVVLKQIDLDQIAPPPGPCTATPSP